MFLTASYIILGIIAFFVLLLSVHFHVSVEYTDYIYLSVRWLFLKFDILPLKEKTKKKKEKPVEEKKEEPQQEAKEEKPKESGENPIITTIKNMGYDGVMEILSNLGKALSGMFRRIFKAFVIQNIDLDLTVGKGDAAATAIEYGKACNKVYPVFGLMTSTMKVRTYNVNVAPDFLAGHNTGEFRTDFYLVPRKLINAFIIVGVELVFKVLLKFLLSGDKKKDKKENIQPETVEKTA